MMSNEEFDYNWLPRSFALASHCLEKTIQTQYGEVTVEIAAAPVPMPPSAADKSGETADILFDARRRSASLPTRVFPFTEVRQASRRLISRFPGFGESPGELSGFRRTSASFPTEVLAFADIRRARKNYAISPAIRLIAQFFNTTRVILRKYTVNLHRDS